MTETADGEYFSFEGYASTFGNTDWYGDTVIPGAFKESLTERMPKLCYQHSMIEPCGVIDEAYEDAKGLFIKGKMPKAMPLVTGTIVPLLKCGAINSFSIGFNTEDSEAKSDGGRNLKKIDLWETSFVTIPADSYARVTGFKSRTIEQIRSDVKTKRDFEKLLRESGLFSKEASVFLASRLNLEPGEPETDIEAKAAHAAMGNMNTEIEKFIKENSHA